MRGIDDRYAFEELSTLEGHPSAAGVKPRARSIRDSRLRFSNYQAFRRAPEVGVAHPNRWSDPCYRRP